MGIFGNKQSDDQQYQDQPVNTSAPEPVAPTSHGSIDGVIPTYQDQTSAPVVADPTNVSAPPVDDQVSDDTGGYIMADPVVPQNNWSDQNEHQHDDFIDAEQPAEPESSVSQESPTQEPDIEFKQPEPESEIDTLKAARSVPSTHPLPRNEESSSELTAIREQALRELSPLVSHLEQSPEERFHTAMMMMQATDDHSLVKTAYEAAQSITDDKTKAQALLDIVNEINYFTQKQS